ncbi:MAG: ATP-binding protein [Spirochaetaceae bacterium]|nr:ATP-binding protein [Spirochaetaceae bacterium]
MLLTSLCFVAAIAVGFFIFFRFRGMAMNYSDFSQKNYEAYIEHLNTTTLADMSAYIEKKYPVLQDTARLKREAGTDWFWEIAEELHEIANAFHFAYIYYIEKSGDNYIFLLSSGIRRGEHPEWLGGPVWEKTPPAFVDAAWETRRLTVSPEPTVNEWGSLVSAVRPIVSNGEVVGLLGIDYNTSFMDGLREQELHQQEGMDALVRRTGIILLVSMFFILAFMGYQLWLSNTSILVPLREMESDERTRIMLDAIPMLCSLWDTNGNIIDCNKRTLTVFGFTEKADYVEHFFDLSPEYQPDGENSRSMVARITEEASATGFAFANWMYRAKTGEEIPVESTIVRVPWKKTWRFVCSSRDMREIRAKEAIARESENRVRVMLDTMVFACLFFDSSIQIVECNQRAVEIFGVADKQYICENFFNLMPEFQPDGSSSREKVKELVRRAFDTGRGAFAWEHHKFDKTPLPAEITLIRVEWKGGYRVVAYIRDLSKLVETEDNLRRTLAMAEASPNISLFLSAEREIEYCNPVVSFVSGIPREELFQGGLPLLFSPEDFGRLTRVYMRAALEDRPVDFEMSVVSRNAQKRDFAFSLFAVEMRNSRTCLSLLGRDITEIKKIQRELVVAKEQAEQALASEVQYNKAKNDFLSKVSHELRTPLNIIIGATKVAQKADKKEELLRCHGEVKEASEHLLGLVNDILDLASFDMGNFSFFPQPFDFKKMIDSVIRKFTLKTQAKKQRFITAIDNRIPAWVDTDEHRIKQILSKLLSNAVEFTPEEGKIGLSVQMTKNDGKECTIRCEVSDTGAGIDKELQQRLLGDAFEQADNSITRKHGGMGLGLPLTQRIVELMKGKLRVESEPGKGSRFTCDVRLGVATDAQRENEMDEKNAADAPGIPNLSGKRILVVDDVDVNREILFALLEDTGAVFDGAADGEEAEKMFLQNKYDLIFMDLHMPVMDGFTAVKNIRGSARPWATTVPIISVSAEGGADLSAKCREAGITDHLTKPVDTEKLFAMITQWMPG